jgi:hypothetical protein
LAWKNNIDNSILILILNTNAPSTQHKEREGIMPKLTMTGRRKDVNDFSKYIEDDIQDIYTVVENKTITAEQKLDTIYELVDSVRVLNEYLGKINRGEEV